MFNLSQSSPVFYNGNALQTPFESVSAIVCVYSARQSAAHGQAALIILFPCLIVITTV